MRYRLIHRGNVIPLSPGATLIGRSVACKVVLDDADVSRRHARLIVLEAGVVIEDLDSADGVLVNGERISARRDLSHGDRIQVGHEELQLLVDEREQDTEDRPATAVAPTKAGAAALDEFWDDEDDAGVEYEQPTALNKRAHMLAQALQHQLAHGEINANDPVLIERLTEMVERGQAGEAFVAQHVEIATRVALRLARTTGEARWVQYVVELHTAMGTVLPLSTLEEIEALADTAGPVDPDVLLAHVERLRSRQRPLSPTERTALQRFERLVARLCAPR